MYIGIYGRYECMYVWEKYESVWVCRYIWVCVLVGMYVCS